ncbi:MAG: GAF domain-containing protein [Leptolyngbyaceae cyanobacterium bins.302]|nr:GAF domain-containing protein [Leptolyngbyaceae cyanobacterium bins.302]
MTAITEGFECARREAGMNSQDDRDEIARLEALHQYQILDTAPESAYDDLTRLAAQICQMPIALIVLLAQDRQWFKSKLGLTVTETPRNIAFCRYTILQTEPLIIEDALADERFATNPLVIDDPAIRFYAGVPLITPDNYAIGSLCVIDTVPRQLSDIQVEALQALSRQVIGQLELRRNLTTLQERERHLSSLVKDLHQTAQREQLIRGVTEHIHRSLDLREILTTTVTEVRQVLQADRVVVFKLEADGSGTVEQESVDSSWKPILGQNLVDPCLQTLCLQKYLTGHVHAVKDIEDGSIQSCHAEFLKQFDVRANLVAPIIQSESLWGLLIVHQCVQPRQWTETETQLLKLLADQVAIAIQQSCLYQQVQAELAERVQAEAKIRDQAMLLDVATDAIVVSSLNHQITFWNQGAERLYGWTTAEVVGRSAELLYRNQAASLKEIAQTVLTNGQWQGELTQRTQDQEDLIVASRWSLVRDPLGQPKAFLIVNTNITQEKILERQFLRTQRLESIGTLAGGIAHDLNNVLAPILMSVSLLEQQPESEKRQKWLDMIDGSARRGAKLVKQVLAFARGSEGERSLLDVKHLIVEIKQVVEETFSRDISITTQIPNDLHMVRGDVTQLHQILMNLCLNGRDAMPNGGILRITAENMHLEEAVLSLRDAVPAGSYITITVTDTGSGIAPDIIDRIFDPFFTTKEIGKGTGLGLSTVMSIVNNHNGFITVSSEIGKGAEFKVYLPALISNENSETLVPETPLGSGQLILIVDDEKAIREATKAMLEANGYQVFTANNGIDAIGLYAHHRHEIQAALIDMMMPGMDGTTTIRTLQAIDPQIKIVATSGLTTSDTLMEMGIHVHHFLMKPFTAQDLLIALNQMLNP